MVLIISFKWNNPLKIMKENPKAPPIAYETQAIKSLDGRVLTIKFNGSYSMIN